MGWGKRVRGITLLGFLIGLIVVGFFAFLIMRLSPVYAEYYGVVQAMNAVAAEPGIASKTPEQIRESLDRKFQISYVESVKPNHVRITRQGGGYILNIRYEVRRPLAYNLDFVAKFDRSVNLARSGPQ